MHDSPSWIPFLNGSKDVSKLLHCHKKYKMIRIVHFNLNKCKYNVIFTLHGNKDFIVLIGHFYLNLAKRLVERI